VTNISAEKGAAVLRVLEAKKRHALAALSTAAAALRKIELKQKELADARTGLHRRAVLDARNCALLNAITAENALPHLEQKMSANRAALARARADVEDARMNAARALGKCEAMATLIARSN